MFVFLNWPKVRLRFGIMFFYIECFPRMVRRFDCYYFVSYDFVCCLQNSFRNGFDILVNVAS